eukprot:TRINITY_DN4797_c0_g5_i1.p1 TRINITY_DN4797_c0_g5~~TRINITY_DN4797_c0_g5_i1.p1  ORF type:complete len:539 (-),score=57.50 TRINITY_DN4797_c0_g5_i1:183-1799(-)
MSPEGKTKDRRWIRSVILLLGLSWICSRSCFRTTFFTGLQLLTLNQQNSRHGLRKQSLSAIHTDPNKPKKKLYDNDWRPLPQFPRDEERYKLRFPKKEPEPVIFEPGSKCKAKVNQTNRYGALLNLEGYETMGWLPLQVMKHCTKIENLQSNGIRTGSIMDLRVLRMKDGKPGRPREVAVTQRDFPDYGTKLKGKVTKIFQDEAVLELENQTLLGYLQSSEVSEKLARHLNIGSEMDVTVKGYGQDDDGDYLDVTTLDWLKPGTKLKARVREIKEFHGGYHKRSNKWNVEMILDVNVEGKVHKCSLNHHDLLRASASFRADVQEGDWIDVSVKEHNQEKLSVSLDDWLAPGAHLKGRVTQYTRNGVRLEELIGHQNVTGWLDRSQIIGKPWPWTVEDSGLEIGSEIDVFLVEARQKKDSNQICVSLREKEIAYQTKMKGTVTEIGDFGATLKLEDQELPGYLHYTQIKTCGDLQSMKGSGLKVGSEIDVRVNQQTPNEIDVDLLDLIAVGKDDRLAKEGEGPAGWQGSFSGRPQGWNR